MTALTGYVLDCLYCDLDTAVANRCRLHLPSVLDQVACTGLRVVAPLVLSNPERISPREAIARAPADVPILLIAGSDDRHATAADGRVLLAACRSPRSELHIVDGSGHLEQFQSPSEQYSRLVVGFLRKAARK